MDASLVFDIDSSQARGAAKALAELNSAVIKTANSASKFERTLRASNGQFQSTGKYLRDNLGEIESLAKAYNPLLAAQIRYRDESIRTGAAVKAGVITEQQRIEILQRTKVALDASANAAQRFGQSQEIARHHVANLSFQLNDIGMMMAMGQSPFMLMMQQGPQVAQILGQMNQEGRKLGPTLAGAFKMFLNPTTAVTLALIGGAAALGQWAMSALGATQNTDGFLDSLDNLTSSANSYATALRTADQSSFALTAQFGAQADSLKRLYDLNVQLEGIKLGQSIREASEQSLTQFRGLGDQLERINRLSGYAVEDIDGMGTATQMLNTEVQRLYDSYGLGVAQANELHGVMEDMARANTMEDQAEAAERFAELLVEAHRAGATIPPELIEIAYRAGVAGAAIREMAAASNEAAAAWSRVGTNTGMFIDSYEGPPGMPSGRGGGGRGSGGSGRSGGGGSATNGIEDEMKRRWESLNEGFQSEYQLSMQHYQRDLETLKWALDQKTITQQEYEANRMMLYTTAWGSEWQQTQLQRQMDIDALKSAFDQKLILEEEYLRRRRELNHQVVSQLGSDLTNTWAYELNQFASHLGDMNQVAGGYDAILRAQKIFGAASALVSTYTGAAEALKLPFPMNIAAAAKVVATGLGFVNAIKGGGKSGGGSSAAATVQQAPKEPTRYVTINWDGPDWMRDGINGLLDEIYDQSKDGRVIIAQERR